MTQEQLKGKFVIAFDTLCDGWQCVMTEDDNGDLTIPVLYDSEDEAFWEMFDDAHSMLINRTGAELKEQGLTRKIVNEMLSVIESKDVNKAKAMFDKYPDLNDNNEWVEPAETFIMNRKTFLTSDGTGYITGSSL